MELGGGEGELEYNLAGFTVETRLGLTLVLFSASLSTGFSLAGEGEELPEESRLLSFLIGELLLLSCRLLSANPDLFRAFSALETSFLISFLTSCDLSRMLRISLTGEGEESRSLCGLSYLSRSSESEDLALSGFFFLPPFRPPFLPLGLGLLSSDLILCLLQ